MYMLCEYSCTYCGRPIETSFVTIHEKHFHANENEFGEMSSLSCYDQSNHGTRTLNGVLPFEAQCSGFEPVPVSA